jgi:hypothetical protein
MTRQLPSGGATNQRAMVANDQPHEFAIRTTSGPTSFHCRYRVALDDGKTIGRLDAQVELDGVVAFMPQLARLAVKRGGDDNPRHPEADPRAQPPTNARPADVTDPSSTEEGLAYAPLQTTAIALLQGLSGLRRPRSGPPTRAALVARRPACPRVPASSKMYRSRTREEPKSRHHGQHKIAHLQDVSSSPLTDSNRRPPPYHSGLLLPGQRTALASALFPARRLVLLPAAPSPKTLSLPRNSEPVPKTYPQRAPSSSRVTDRHLGAVRRRCHFSLGPA